MPDVLTVENERHLLQTLLERVGQRAHAEREIELQHANEVAKEQNQYQQVFQLLSDNYDAERQRLEESHESQIAESNRKCQVESAKVQAEYQRVLTEAEDRYQRDHDAATKEHDEAVWLVSSLLDDDSEGSPLQRLQQSSQSLDAAEIELKAGSHELDAGYERVVRFLQRSHIGSELTDLEPSISIGSVEEMKSACLTAMSASSPLRQRILGRTLPTLFMGFAPILVFLAFTFTLFIMIWGLVDPGLIGLKLKATDRDWLLIAAGVCAAFSLIPTLFLHLIASRQVWSDYEQLSQLRADAKFAYSIWERTSRTELNLLEAECSRLQELRVKRRDSAIGGAAAKLQDRLSEVQRARANTLNHAGNAYPAQLNLLEARRVQECEVIEQTFRTDIEDLIFRREADFRSMQSEFDSRMGFIRRQYQQSWIELIRSWQSGLSQLGQVSDELCSAVDAICPSWNQVIGGDAPVPAISPSVLGLGRIDVDLNLVEGGLSSDPRLKVAREKYDAPILLPLLTHPSLIVKTKASSRDAAVKILQTSMLRYLTSLPPGKVRFTIMDPVGLGANFSAFMHLADFDELLVTSRIWTEPSHIEKRLADLTEHMETILQTYLRNEFATIDEYNEFAGEVAEPYRVVVIANFPANFTDVALRRLASIADGGRRCGVYFLMSIDASQEMPRGFSLTDLEKFATVLESTEYGFRHSDPDLFSWPLRLDQPPEPEEFGKLVRQAGQKSRDVRRVEVPFERVAPADEQFWSRDSRAGIDIPIGRAGATKLQSMRLGKGTSQHVLIAGKTGSGKSTLLHALITNLALYYSPAEIEFYLIDFKKGVEFKVYAEQRLPHARVIAIESDREFGVSVLERLDTLLRDRGELFREVGVQDIAGFRNARPDTVMPRTLLLVDEFQEFFIEDDALSQHAALLLDRLIRQGRAFGVHILLGSQTLAGAYSLARSTLGQVAVRIALQCSDTDAHLILSEENTAARLLTRPGEAIYNDANGLIEGNHPFQVVWLGDKSRDDYLKKIRSAADRQLTTSGIVDSRLRTALPAPVVFEGNIPADPAICLPLRQALEQRRTWSAGPPPGTAGHSELVRRCWLGDSVSLGGPIELAFSQREGSNVLIVGRDEEAALGIMITSALAIISQSVPSEDAAPIVDVLDGSLANSPAASSWCQLEKEGIKAPAGNGDGESGLQSLIRVRGSRETTEVILDLHRELERRAGEPGQPRFLFLFDLTRFRELRKAEDDYGFGGSGDKSTNPAQLLTEILRDGPSAGIFTFAWVDSYQSTQRWLSREQLNRFEDRIAFAMNANDSSSLIDSPAAGRLGENRAVLYRGQTGIIEKFRPFSITSLAWLQELKSPALPSTDREAEFPTAELPSIPVEAIVEDSPAPMVAQTSEWADDLPNIDDLNVQ